MVLPKKKPGSPLTKAAVVSRIVRTGRGRKAACVVWLRHASPGIGLIPVAGLSLSIRSCLEAAAAGFSPVVLAVPEEDRGAIELLLAANDPRLTDVELLPDGQPGSARLGSLCGETVVFFGDAVWDRSLTRKAAAPLPSRCPARVWTGPDGVCTFARVRAGELGRFLENPVSPGSVSVIRDPNDGDRIVRIKAPADAPAAERVLLRALRKTADGLFSRHLSRPVSLMITSWLARFPVRPNHVTALVCISSALAAILASQGTRSGFIGAACCVWVAAILDGCDGELARLKYLGTRAGAWMDTISDDLSLAAIIGGLAAGLHRATGQDQWFEIGAIGLVGFCLTYPPRWYLFARDPHAGDHQRLAAIAPPGGRAGLGALAHLVKQTVVRSDFLPYFMLVGVLTGMVPATLVGLTLAMLAGVVDTAMTFFVRRPRWSAAGLEDSHAG